MTNLKAVLNDGKCAECGCINGHYGSCSQVPSDMKEIFTALEQETAQRRERERAKAQPSFSRKSYRTALKRIERELDELRPAANALNVSRGLTHAIAAVRDAAIDLKDQR